MHSTVSKYAEQRETYDVFDVRAPHNLLLSLRIFYVANANRTIRFLSHAIRMLSK